METKDPRWNLNIHYHRVVLEAIPIDARTALDVGSGDGLLTFDLADCGLRVTGLDVDQASVRRASADSRASVMTKFAVGDLFTFPAESGSFDVVASIAMLHHVDAGDGVRRLRDLVRPGGVLAIVGFARASSVGDRVRAVAGMALKKAAQLRGATGSTKHPLCGHRPSRRRKWPTWSNESFRAQRFATVYRIGTPSFGPGPVIESAARARRRLRRDNGERLDRNDRCTPAATGRRPPRYRRVGTPARGTHCY